MHKNVQSYLSANLLSAKIVPGSTLGIKTLSITLHLSLKCNPNNLIENYYWIKQRVIIKMQHTSMDI